MTRQENFDIKIKQLREGMQKRGFAALEINSQPNFSCLSRGRGFIGLASVTACASILVTEERVCLISDNIEGKRLYIEQMDQNPIVELMEYPWDDGAQKDKIISGIVKGKPLARESDMAAELFQMRTRLTAYDIEDYRRLCRDTAEKIEEICIKKIKAGMTEYELAGIISQAFWSINIEPITILIAFDDRARKYRHPVPAGAGLENYALVAVCGRRNGLISSVTRNVMIKPDTEFTDKNKRCAEVMACILDQLTVGTSLSSIFGKLTEAYTRAGYEGEQKYHHQGGLTGFIPREIRAVADSAHCVAHNEAYAFNPSIQGAKCEDTVLVTPTGIENMTYTGNYQYISCNIQGKEWQLPAAYVLNQ